MSGRHLWLVLKVYHFTHLGWWWSCAYTRGHRNIWPPSWENDRTGHKSYTTSVRVHFCGLLYWYFKMHEHFKVEGKYRSIFCMSWFCTTFVTFFCLLQFEKVDQVTTVINPMTSLMSKIYTPPKLKRLTKTADSSHSPLIARTNASTTNSTVTGAKSNSTILDPFPARIFEPPHTVE